MPDWPSDHQVLDTAEKLGAKIIDLLNDAGGDAWPGSPGIPGSPGDTIVRSLHHDALDVLSLDPQKISDEFERMQTVCRSMSLTESSDLIDAFRSIDYSVQDWQGDGARAFQPQVSMIQGFVGQQSKYTLATIRSLVVLLGISTHIRKDYCALAAATMAAADKAMKLSEEADTKYAIGLGASLVTTLTGIGLGGSILSTTVGFIISASGTTIQRAVDDATYKDVAKGYTGGRSQIIDAFKSGINDAKSIIEKARSEMSAEKNELFAPTPPVIDVTKPEFHYSAFYSAARDVSQFDARVEGEKVKADGARRPDGASKPKSVLQQRLDG
ncbi:hypothetical protein [Amycolatopsis sp. CA-230715]|uniref:hypothetical protein n=1 Tax=Amycolatopsis sp. CA-230715 TaxID=2745196 RepID=UPI001C026705|nr:hypothetical protein [Amycolatopsis sp. CA-230715]QWF80361.1 hypothetical protein HUW46_03781 [Amycolatopsis sp. CA-230715]